MSTEQETNKAAIRRFHDATTTRDPELIAKTIDEMLDPDALVRTPLPIDATGARAMREVWARLLRVYPDLHVTIEDLLAEADKVVSRNTVTGTHQGEYMGHPPTGKTVTYSEIFIFRFAHGRIAETWGVVDVFSQMKQTGVIPAAPEQLHLEPAASPRDDHDHPNHDPHPPHTRAGDFSTSLVLGPDAARTTSRSGRRSRSPAPRLKEWERQRQPGVAGRR